MIKTVVLVPIRDNDGRPFPKALWEALQGRFMRFGGYTRPIGVVGAWEAGGRVYHDRSRQYTVTLASWRQLAAWLAVVDWARGAFRQEAMYVEVAGVPEILGDPGSVPGTQNTEGTARRNRRAQVTIRQSSTQR